jgi:hypothetical protein
MHAMTTILLAIDVMAGRPLQHVGGAIDMAAQQIRDDADRIIVLHVREFSLPRTCCTSARCRS